MGDEMSDEQRVEAWATACKLSTESIKVLAKEGFTSMEALALLEEEDMSATKMPRGQQKLVLRGVRQMKTTDPLPTQAKDVHPPQDSNATKDSDCNTEDPYSALLAQALQGGLAGPGLGGASMLGASNGNSDQHATVLNRGRQPAQLNQVTWDNPQIHLETAAGKTSSQFYDIADFIAPGGGVEDQILTKRTDGPEFIIRTGASKPKIESISVPQWSLANLAILHKLMSEGMNRQGVLDYLSHTARIYQFLKNFEGPSVFLFDREYRRLQGQFDYRWGTDVGHLQTVWLRRKTMVPPRENNMRGSSGSKPGKGPMTTAGKEICKLFNSQKGCPYNDCKFIHVCSVGGCEKSHSALVHRQMT